MAYKRIVLKVGSNVITRENGLPDEAIFASIASQIASLKRQGIEVVLVSSGAVASGRNLIPDSVRWSKTVQRQVLAAVGQPRLMRLYSDLFAKENLLCAQLLATKEDFRDKSHYVNMKNCLLSLLRENIVPVVNENDTVAVQELMFTDNDELSALLATMLDADLLLLLTSVDGILDFSKNPPELLRHIAPDDRTAQQLIVSKRSSAGRGGMVSKYRMALKAAENGIAVHIANGKTPGLIERLALGGHEGTRFEPQRKRSAVKRWMPFAATEPKGRVWVDEKAALALQQTVCSLLPVGIRSVEGDFEKGDLVEILDPKETQVGIGLAQYGADAARKWVGQKGKKPLVHYDYLLIG
ncbi:MAG: glutamate 5-kinase [Saprospiraceae bacterium]